MATITLRPVQEGDGLALAQMHLENAAYYVQLAPDDFQMPTEEGLAEFIEPGPDANTATTLAIVAEIDGEIAGYLEAQLLPPMDTARYQTPSDLARARLFITRSGPSSDSGGAEWRHGLLRRQRSGVASTALQSRRATPTPEVPCRFRSGKTEWAIPGDRSGFTSA